ncbi:MAG: nucleoside phosphorylase [Arcobacteraceae bacterium]
MMSNSSKTLIHTALLCEAQTLIQFLKLHKINSNLYENEKYSLVISGIGKLATQKYLTKILQKQKFNKAINIGIAGCQDETIAIGTLFCTTHKSLENIPYATLSTVDIALNCKKKLTTLLADMEAKYFIQICETFVAHENIYCLKIVSDYLSSDIPKKAFVTTLVQKNLPLIKEIL